MAYSESAKWFRRDGTPYQSMEEWATDYENQVDRRVAKTHLWWGGYVSTVWLGLDHNFYSDGPPLIFETMVFPSNSYDELDMARYSTEAEAKAGHERMVKVWKYSIHKIAKCWLFVILEKIKCRATA